MPALRKRSTTVASNGLTYPFNIFEPAVVRQSRVTKISLCAIGTPVSGPAVPAARRASASAACASDNAWSTCRKALCPLASMRPR